jgi:hypothetical protein
MLSSGLPVLAANILIKIPYSLSWHFINFYMNIRRIAILSFLEIAVSRVPVSVSPNPSRRTGAS